MCHTRLKIFIHFSNSVDLKFQEDFGFLSQACWFEKGNQNVMEFGNSTYELDNY